MLRLNITDKVLDKLGFGPYQDGSGDWGTRTLVFNNDVRFEIRELDEKDDDMDGYGGMAGIEGKYCASHFEFDGHELFFLHQMYECIEKYFPSCLDEFVEKCDEMNMKPYIDDFLDHRKTT